MPATKLSEATLTELPTTHLAKATLAKLATAKTTLAELASTETALAGLATAKLTKATLAKLAELPARTSQHVPGLNRNHRVGAAGTGGPHNGAWRVGAVRIVVAGPGPASHSANATDSATYSTNSIPNTALAKLT
ncbi:MAG: hypothetical protein ACKOS8_11410 [Gemmataceae bacterium]